MAGAGDVGESPSCPQLTPQQKAGKSVDEAGSVAGILEIKVMVIGDLLST